MSNPPDRYLQSWKLATVTFSLCLGTFLIALDVNIIGVAVPEISSVFNSLGDASWYATAYLLTVTAFQPTMGHLYKCFSTRSVYFGNILIFEVGSILCAAAPSSNVFILGRAIAGLGAAGLLQGALAIIGQIVELEKRPLYMGIVISVFGLSICVGPVMGGAFVDSIGWRWCFWINLPIGAAAVILLGLLLRLQEQNNEYRKLPLKTKLTRMDPAGTIVFLGAICCLTLAVQWGGQTKPWKSADIIGLLVGFGLLTIIFVILQYRNGDDALIPAKILRQRSVLVGSTFLFFIGILNFIYSFYLPFYFQAAQGVSPVTSGVRIIPFVLAQIIFIGITGGLATKWGHYVPYMIGGMVICSVGAGMIVRLDVTTPTAEWAAYLVIAGAGLGMAMQLPYSAVQVVLSEADVSTGNALFVFFNQLGGIVGIAIGQNLFLSELRAQVAQRIPSLDPMTVVAAGAANLRLLAGSSEEILTALRTAYAEALQRPYILGLAAACTATVLSFGMEWKNIKTEADQRRIALERETNEIPLSSTSNEKTGVQVRDDRVPE